MRYPPAGRPDLQKETNKAFRDNRRKTLRYQATGKVIRAKRKSKYSASTNTENPAVSSRLQARKKLRTNCISSEKILLSEEQKELLNLGIVPNPDQDIQKVQTDQPDSAAPNRRGGACYARVDQGGLGDLIARMIFGRTLEYLDKLPVKSTDFWKKVSRHRGQFYPHTLQVYLDARGRRPRAWETREKWLFDWDKYTKTEDYAIRVNMHATDLNERLRAMSNNDADQREYFKQKISRALELTRQGAEEHSWNFFGTASHHPDLSQPVDPTPLLPMLAYADSYAGDIPELQKSVEKLAVYRPACIRYVVSNGFWREMLVSNPDRILRILGCTAMDIAEAWTAERDKLAQDYLEYNGERIDIPFYPNYKTT